MDDGRPQPRPPPPPGEPDHTPDGQPGQPHPPDDPWSTVAVTLPGLVPELTSPRLRRRQFTTLARRGVDAAAQLEAARREAPKWNIPTYPTTTWVIGTRHPERLLTAIENALLAAGRPDARGLAARELADPVTERWRHPLHDDIL